jgi:hypothetical protein
MSLSAPYRRGLAFAAASLIVQGIYTYWPTGSTPTVATGSAQTPSMQSMEQAEARLARLRDIAASVPAKETVLKSVAAELATRENGLIQADTAQQAQALLIQMIRQLALSEAVPVEIRSTEIGAVVPYGDAYGAVSIAVQMECRVEQLINLLAAVGSRPELVAPSELRVSSSSPKEKTLGVRLTLTALVPRKLVPEKKGAL